MKSNMYKAIGSIFTIIRETICTKFKKLLALATANTFIPANHNSKDYFNYCLSHKHHLKQKKLRRRQRNF